MYHNHNNTAARQKNMKYPTAAIIATASTASSLPATSDARRTYLFAQNKVTCLDEPYTSRLVYAVYCMGCTDWIDSPAVNSAATPSSTSVNMPVVLRSSEQTETYELTILPDVMALPRYCNAADDIEVNSSKTRLNQPIMDSTHPELVHIHDEQTSFDQPNDQHKDKSFLLPVAPLLLRAINWYKGRSILLFLSEAFVFLFIFLPFTTGLIHGFVNYFLTVAQFLTGQACRLVAYVTSSYGRKCAEKISPRKVLNAGVLTIMVDDLVPPSPLSLVMSESGEEVTQSKEENQKLLEQVDLLKANGQSLSSSYDSQADLCSSKSASSLDESLKKIDGNDLKDELTFTKKRLRVVAKAAKSSIEKLKNEVNELKEELNQTRKCLQTVDEAKNALHIDMEKFAETFATQHSELQRLEGRVRKLVSENYSLRKQIRDAAV